MRWFIDMTGQVIGRLTVLGRAKTLRHVNEMVWECLCRCGAVVQVRGNNLRHRTRSCGCQSQENKKRPKTHGLSNTREYRIWCGIRKRCYSPTFRLYHHYGGRGIVMSAEWHHDFLAFYRDMGPCPPGYSIDRIDNNGPYSKENCRWATQREQTNNTRRNHHLTLNGETHNISEWAHLKGWDPRIIRSRIRYGWPIERILTTHPITRAPRAT